MIVTRFSDRREQANAIGVYSFVAASGASLGLLAGGRAQRSSPGIEGVIALPPVNRRTSRGATTRSAGTIA